MTEQYPESSEVVGRYLIEKAKDIGCPPSEFVRAVLVAYVSKITSEHVKPCKICSENVEVNDRLRFLYELGMEMLTGVVKKSRKETDQMFSEMFPVMKEMYDD